MESLIGRPINLRQSARSWRCGIARRLDLAYTEIKAPKAGVVVNFRLQLGEQVKAQTPLFALVTDRRPWLEANFKETDLTHVTAGQKAKVVLDMHPDVTWDAEVESISPATGAEFAILPAQNASGNWVKVVQRLPVRLRLIEQGGEPPLRAGMTAYVSIDTGRTSQPLEPVRRWPCDCGAPQAGRNNQGGMIGRMAKNSNGWMRRLRARPQYHSRHFGRRLIYFPVFPLKWTSSRPVAISQRCHKRSIDSIRTGRQFRPRAREGQLLRRWLPCRQSATCQRSLICPRLGPR